MAPVRREGCGEERPDERLMLGLRGEEGHRGPSGRGRGTGGDGSLQEHCSECRWDKRHLLRPEEEMLQPLRGGGESRAEAAGHSDAGRGSSQPCTSSPGKGRASRCSRKWKLRCGFGTGKG